MILLLLACTGSTDSGDLPDFPEVDHPEATPTWSAEQVSAALAEALALGFPGVWYARDIYFDFLSHGDEDCPGSTTYVEWTLDGCTADSGYWYGGGSEYNVGTASEYDLEYDYWGIGGDGVFTDPAGNRFEFGGHLTEFSWADPDSDEVGLESSLSGTWLWEGDDAWLGSPGLSASLITNVVRSSEETWFKLNGGVTWGGLSINTEELIFDAACDYGPVGGLEIRDPGGAWYEVTFKDCDPCAEVSFNGDSVGDTCFDLQGVLDTLRPHLDALL